MVDLVELFAQDIAIWVLVLLALILAGFGVGVAFINPSKNGQKKNDGKDHRNDEK